LTELSGSATKALCEAPEAVGWEGARVLISGWTISRKYRVN